MTTIRENITTNYVVLPLGGYPDTVGDYIVRHTRREVEVLLVDSVRRLDNPGLYVIKITDEEAMKSFLTRVDPYTTQDADYYVYQGPCGDVQWELS